MPSALQHQTLDLSGLLDPRGGRGRAQSRGLWAVEVGASREMLGVTGGFSWVVGELSGRSRVAASVPVTPACSGDVPVPCSLRCRRWHISAWLSWQDVCDENVTTLFLLSCLLFL